VLDGLRGLTSEKGCSISQFALAWIAAQPGVTCPIIGPSQMEQLEDNLGAQYVPITEEDRKAIDEWVPPGTFVQDYYNADFGPHFPHW
jgi:aryl-alcohol dehydrogenase-like predicted oxidoreductase